MTDSATTPTTESTTDEGAARSLSLLAKEEFGNSYKGEIAEPAPEGEDAPVEEEKPESDEAEVAAEGGEETAGDEAGEPSNEEGEGQEEVPISSLSELTEHQEWDPEWVNSLKVQVKVDGEPAEATLADLKASFQMNAAADKRLEEAKKAKADTTAELAEKAQALDSQFAAAAELIKGVESILEQDTKSIDWAKLRDDDPAEYSAKKTEVAERRQNIDAMKARAVESYQTVTDERRQQMQAHLTERRQTEEAALLEKIPEWQDADKAKGEKSQLAKYLMDGGFSQEEVNNALDHRLILLARKAMLYEEGKIKVNAAKKKVAKVPKVLNPGASKPKEQISKERADKMKAKLRQSGSLDDAYALLQAQRGAS